MPPATPATAAIYYHPDAYSIGRSDLKGRHAAGAGFLSALARHHQAPALQCATADRRSAVEFARLVEQAAGRPRPVVWLPSSEPAKLAAAGCLFLPGPSLGDAAWQRRVHDQRAYSLCGVTHTICSNRVMDAFGDYMIAPVQPWDALIVTSRPARAAIASALEGWGDYLQSRFGAPALNPIQLPVIPLGVDCDRFADTPEHRALGTRLRQAHGIGTDDVAVLFFGRLSFHAKAHPLAMFLACERAQRRSKRRIHLILTGAASNPEIEQEFREGAQRYCPSVNTILLDGSDPAHALSPWFAADIFMSLSDNIQETFGLTPIEAMAAGLPVLVSDWDGYRDTITDTEVGFRIPTQIPPVGGGQELALRHLLEIDSFDRYIGAVSQATAVDSDAAGDALLRLVEDAGLRHRMGEAGRRRARSLFDWSVVIAAYERLWEELAQLRASAPEVAPRHPDAPAIPLRPDPFVMFQAFATRQMGLETRLSCPHEAPLAVLDGILASAMNSFAIGTLLPVEEIRRLLQHLGTAERRLEELYALVPPERRERVGRTVGWLVKCALVEARLAS
ncbi:glycosyltransferase family 4 protein [Azospirillum picis]|uniref:Glycosyltransferase involved in cell wall biosynthesis n=1 Tax=Azospirillum picis TaxID=488438 RepID=A0ABU0MTJ4_9PROT|nr:glycosyltransferase family 4 protein [Azospirillum picis]MBP2303073.1 glycosyltransferase involved in cell wall biosynthesis [Azospirillum picis]MDQ0536813.1 glycosyltransferase involved in cell wall biosynthesis [Azospirillum picis]